MARDLRTDLASLRIDRRAPERTGYRWLWIGALTLLAGLALGGWWWTGRVQAAPVRAVAVIEQGAGEPAGILNASGYVTARRRATVSAKVTGRVTEVLVEEGLAVRRGQVLARLDQASARASLNLAEAQLAAAGQAVVESEVRLEEARLTLGRRTQLVEEGVLGQADLDAARAEVDSLAARIALAREQVRVAERQVEIRRTDLDDLVIRAPFDGVVISRDAQPGEMVSPISAGGGFTRTGICTLVDMSSLEIEVDVNESYINRVVPGQPVTATLDAYPDWRIPARVITTVPAADRQKATVLVRIGFETLDPRVLPDMGVKVTFLQEPDREGGEMRQPQLLIPRAAVRTADGRDVVYVLRDDRVERRAVRMGTGEGEQAVVLAGLAAGERVVVEGPADLADGDRVVMR